jgi:hypothetical protein
MDKKIEESIKNALQSAWDERQSRPDQYVVGYYRKDNDELIGYHASTFCQITKDILKAKRYSGEDPYTHQLPVIAKNIKSTLDKEVSEEEIFGPIFKQVKESFGDLKSSDIYLDVTYLCEGTEKQDMKFHIISNE